MLNKEQKSVLRILDANFNRLKEAFRVLEDYVRFTLSEEDELCLILKEGRHLLSLKLLPLLKKYQIVNYRDIENDTVFFKRTPLESQRKTLFDICLANLQRAKEASRSLEEFSKLIHPDISVEAQKVRWHVYKIEKQFILKLRGE